ncbi:hypothetical protein D3C73_1551260 [compost metagenome]
MQGDDTRQSGHATDESGQVVIGAGDRDLDRQLDVERLGDLRQQLDLFELQATAQPRSRDVFQQAGDFGVAGQLP